MSMNLERNGDMTATQIAQRFIEFDSDEIFLRAVTKLSDRRFDEIYATYLKMANKERTKRKKLFFSKVKSKAIVNEADYLRVMAFSKIIAIKAIEKGDYRNPNGINKNSNFQTLAEFMESFRVEVRTFIEKSGDKYSDDQFKRMFAEIKNRATKLYFYYRSLNKKSIKDNGKYLSFVEGKEIIFSALRDEDDLALRDYAETTLHNKFIQRQTEYMTLLFMWRDLPENQR